ncbi:hypothetical protein V6N13_134532 [Hibiscus sabdariffa]
MLIKWLVNTLQRPWGIARNLAEFDSLVCDCLSFRFQFADLMKSSLAALLAQDDFNRNDRLIAWCIAQVASVAFIHVVAFG